MYFKVEEHGRVGMWLDHVKGWADHLFGYAVEYDFHYLRVPHSAQIPELCR